MSPTEAAQALRSGKVSIVVKPQNDSFDYRFDPTRPESRTARLIVDDVLQRGKGRTDVVKIGEEKITEPGARYVDFLVPGLIGMNLMGSGLWGLGFTVVIARSRKILKRFAATPMRRSHYLFSFMLSRLVFLVLEVAAVVVFAWLAFGFTVRGSWLSLILVTMLGRLYFLRHRIARRRATNDDRRRIGPDELHHASNVVAVRHVLLVRTISSSAATVHQSTAADGAEQCAPGVDERRRGADVQLDPNQHSACVVCCEFYHCTEDL